MPDMRLIFPIHGMVLSVGTDDVVMAVQEGDAMNQAGTAFHRYQVLFMGEGNVLGGFWTDLGPASEHTLEVKGESVATPPYQQPILNEHTVAECQHMAEMGRNDDYAIELLAKDMDESTLFADYQRLIEEDMAMVSNRSSFGPTGQTQRGGYSKLAVREVNGW